MTKKQGTANLRHLPKYNSHLGYFIPTPQKESPRTVSSIFSALSSEHTHVLTKYSNRLTRSTYCGTATCLTGMTSQTSTSCKYTIMVESTVYLVHDVHMYTEHFKSFSHQPNAMFSRKAFGHRVCHRRSTHDRRHGQKCPRLSHLSHRSQTTCGTQGLRLAGVDQARQVQG